MMNIYANNSQQLLKYNLYKNFGVNVDILLSEYSGNRWEIENASFIA